MKKSYIVLFALPAFLVSGVSYGFESNEVTCTATLENKKHQMVFNAARSELLGEFEYNVQSEGYSFTTQIDPRTNRVFAYVRKLDPGHDVLAGVGAFSYDFPLENQHYFAVEKSDYGVGGPVYTEFGITCIR